MNQTEFLSSLNLEQKQFIINIFLWEQLTGECQASTELLQSLGINTCLIGQIAHSGNIKQINMTLQKYGVDKKITDKLVKNNIDFIKAISND